MARPRDPAGIAAAILGPGSKETTPDVGPDDSADEDTEAAALGATADQMMGAIKSGDREALVDALRSLKMLMA